MMCNFFHLELIDLLIGPQIIIQKFEVYPILSFAVLTNLQKILAGNYFVSYVSWHFILKSVQKTF